MQSYQWGVAGIAGIFGYYIGGVLTQADYSKESFFIGGTVSLLINVSACFLDKRLEDGTKDIVRMNCCKRTKHNFAMIKQGFKTSELSRSFIFFII